MNPTIALRDTVKYHGDIGEDHLGEIRRRLSRGEGGSPLSFRGREDVINHIKSLLEELTDTGIHRSECLTEVIQGSPGAGKTTLLNHLKEQGSEKVTAISILGTNCQSEEAFLAAIYKDLNVDTTATHSPKKAKFSFDLKIFGAGRDYDKSKPSQFETRAGRSIWNLLETLLPNKCILLCIDEAQNVGPSEGQSRANVILGELHERLTGNLHIVPVLAGLLDTRAALDSVNLSRQNRSTFMLDSLTKSEAREVVIGTLNHDSLGLSGLFKEEDQDYLASSLMVASDQWPRHLHYYIHGVLNEILEDQLRGTPSHQINTHRALHFGHQERVMYYGDRIETFEMKIGAMKTDPFVSELMSESNNLAINLNALSKRLLAHHDVSTSEFDEMFEEAVHVGILTPPEHTTGGVKVTRFPIPSMRTFFQCQCISKQTISKLQDSHDKQLLLEMKK